MSKPANIYFLKLSGFFLLFFALQSCTAKSGSWKNEQIKAGKRKDLHQLSDQVFTALKANDLGQVKLFMSKELIENTYTPRQVELISNSLSVNKYNLLDEYYAVNKYIDADTIKAAGICINSYDLYYPGTAREMYIAFFIPATGNNKFIISTIYAKYNYGWKLSDLDLAPFTINGKTAPELFKLAKEEYSKKYLIDAVNTMALATSCASPTSVWHYPDEGDIREFYSKVLNEANEKYKFPFVLSGVSTRPMIIKVYNETSNDGWYPMVYYMTHISLKDTNAIKMENIEVKKEIGKMMPGIDKDNKYVFYDAFNERPTGKKAVDHFDMVDKLK
jgi:hypothetical protein